MSNETLNTKEEELPVEQNEVNLPEPLEENVDVPEEGESFTKEGDPVVKDPIKV